MLSEKELQISKTLEEFITLSTLILMINIIFKLSLFHILI